MAPRRASSSSHPLWIASVLLLLLLLSAGYWFFSWWNDPFRATAPLPVPSYLENAGSLRGNIYRIEGKVANQLGWSPTEGRLISVELESLGNDLVGLLIPAAFNSVNIQKGQRFLFEVEVTDKGLLRTRSLRKS